LIERTNRRFRLYDCPFRWSLTHRLYHLVAENWCGWYRVLASPQSCRVPPF